MSKVEEVARALDPLAWAVPEDDYPAEKARREAKQFQSLSAARRAIEAMREPTEAMKVNGGIAIEQAAFEQGKVVFEAAGGAFQAMISAALNEEG